MERFPVHEDAHPAFAEYKALFEEPDPKKLQRRFLMTLLRLQNVQRGSIWVRQGEVYRCVEAAGIHSEKR